MPKIVDHSKIRTDLMRATVCAVSKYGIDGCTSRKIALESKINEAYIFRYFLDIFDLRANTFKAVIRKWMNKIGLLSELGGYLNDDKTSSEDFYFGLWNLLHDAPDEVAYFTQFYHSQEYDSSTHMTVLGMCLDVLRSREPNVSYDDPRPQQMFEAILITTEYLVMVFRGILLDSPDTFNKVLSILSCQRSLQESYPVQMEQCYI